MNSNVLLDQEEEQLDQEEEQLDQEEEQQTTSTFDTTEPLLKDLLRDIRTGKIQLPDFQRA